MKTGLTVRGFEYAVRLYAPLLAVFRYDGGEWKFVTNLKRWNAITVCQLEQMYGNDVKVFPVGMMPDQIWQLLHKLDRQENG